MYSDLNIIELDDEHKEQLKQAIYAKQTHIQIGSKSYPVNLLTAEKGVLESLLVHNIESYQYQKLQRDIIIKLVPQKTKDIYFLVKYMFRFFVLSSNW